MVPVTAGCLQYPFSCPLIINGSRIFSREQAAQWKMASLSPSIEGELRERIQLLGLHLKGKEPPLVSCFPVPFCSLAANWLRAILHPRKRVTPEKTDRVGSPDPQQNLRAELHTELEPHTWGSKFFHTGPFGLHVG